MRSLTYVEIDVPAFADGSPEEIVTYRFAIPTDYLPREIDAIPSIQSVSFTPATISLGENLGQRASVKVALIDHRHIFNGEAFEQGSFWGKWRGRYGTKLRGRSFRLIRGLVGQSLDEMDTRHYLIEMTDGPSPDGVYAIEAKDVLKFADDDRAQAPRLSNGSLLAPIDPSDTSADLNPAGIGDLEYPASGFICLGGKEVVSFTRSGDALTMVRGQLGTTAISHDDGDRAQLVLRYSGSDVALIMADLFENYAGVPGAFIPLVEWQEETAAHLSVLYSATLTEPMSVKTLVSEIIEQAALAVWWDDQAQLIRLQVLREISTDAETFDEDRVVSGSLKVKEQPEKRLSQVWTYYGQRDPTDQADNNDNYRAALATVDLETETEYGSPEIAKITGRWLETINAAERLNQIKLSRFRDPPRRFNFSLFRSEQINSAAGYQLRWWANQNALGEEIPALIQVTRVTMEPDFIHVEAEEMLASGVIVLTNTVFLELTGGVFQWEVPSTWNDANNSIALLGAGGGGADGSTGTGSGGRGGGGGAYSRIANLALTPLSMVDYRVGSGGANNSGGGDTWFNGASLSVSSVAAKGGGGGGGGTGGGIGGQASAGIGSEKASGGNGHDGGTGAGGGGGGGGGGGAGGPHGNGGQGKEASSSGRSGGGGGADGGGNGGNDANGNNNRFGIGGGQPNTSPVGFEGGGGAGGEIGDIHGDGGTGQQQWTQTVAPVKSAGPGGGGGGGPRFQGGSRGGLYGGGGGGAGAAGVIGVPRFGGHGRQGIIVISWREAE